MNPLLQIIVTLSIIHIIIAYIYYLLCQMSCSKHFVNSNYFNPYSIP